MQSRSRVTIGFLLAIALLSASLRLLFLLNRPLWFDELFTLWAARLPLPDLLEALRLDSGPPGFYAGEKPLAAWTDRLAQSDWLIRMPSFLAGLALLLGVRALPAGIARGVFVLLLSGSTLLNLYAGEARPYAVLALLVFALFGLSLRGEEAGRRLLAVAGVTALALYTHYLALFAVAALVLLAAAARRWKSCGALLAGSAAFLPWFPVLRAQPRAAVAWISEPFAAAAVALLSALGGVGRVPGPFGPPVPAAVFFAGAAVGTLALALLLGRGLQERDARESAAFVLLVLTGVLAAGLWKPILFAGRTEMVVLPVWIWGLASAAPGSRVLRWTCVAAAGLGLAATSTLVLRAPIPSAPVAVTESLERVAAAEDVVLAAASYYLPARLASERGRLAASVEALPSELASHPGWFVPAVPGAAEEALLARTMAALPPGGRLFLVVPAPYQTAAFERALEGSGTTRALVRSREAFVTLWTPDPASPSPR